MKVLGLDHKGDVGPLHVLRVRDETGENPLRTANRIAEIPGVESSTPEILVELEAQPGTPPPQGWHLNAAGIAGPVSPQADIQVRRAWEITQGSRDVVVAVMDDGFVRSHPAFSNIRIDHEKDFVEGDLDPSPHGEDRHGTAVASLALGTLGIVKNCTFLPLRVRRGSQRQAVGEVAIAEAFEYASKHADIVICSIGGPPKVDQLQLNASVRNVIRRVTKTGGRRGRGLVVVCSAGNSDLPTFINDNTTRFKFNDGGEVREVPPGSFVSVGLPTIEGVIGVGAVSSLLRKSGYSN